MSTGQLIGLPASSTALALLVVRRHLPNVSQTQFCGQNPIKLVAMATSLEGLKNYRSPTASFCQPCKFGEDRSVKIFFNK